MPSPEEQERLNQELLRAIRRDKEDVRQNKDNYLENLLNKGANPNVADKAEGLTALQWATMANNVRGVELMLAKGANINAKGPGLNSSTSLRLAVGNGDLELVKLLLKNGADIEQRPGKNADGENALEANSRLMEAGNKVATRQEIAKLLEVAKRGIMAQSKDEELLKLVSQPYDKNDNGIDRIKNLLKQGANPDAALAVVQKALEPYNARQQGPEDNSRTPAINEQNIPAISRLQEIETLLETAKGQKRGIAKHGPERDDVSRGAAKGPKPFTVGQENFTGRPVPLFQLLLSRTKYLYPKL